MAFLDIMTGNANAVIENLEDRYSVSSTGIRRAGALAALMSPQNRAGGFELNQRDAMDGYRKEYFLRFKKNGFCGESALNSETSAGLDVCDADNMVDFPGSWTGLPVEYDTANFTYFGRKWSLDAAAFNNEWGNSMIEEQARRIQEAIDDIIVKQMNANLFAALETAAGGYMDPDTATVTAAGTTKTFKVLNEYGAPLVNFEDEFSRLLRWNEMGDAPMIIHGDNALATFTRRRSAEAGLGVFTANDEGVDLGRLANALGYIPYLDTVGQLFGSKTKENSLMIAPGAARLLFNSDFVADTVVDFPHYKRFTITGPYGIPLEWEWKYNDCGANKGEYIMLIRVAYRLVAKPTTINHCEMAGTNNIIKADFSRCAAVGCPEDAV